MKTFHCLATSHIIEFLEAFEALLDKKAMVINSNSCAHWHVRGDDQSAVVGRFFQAWINMTTSVSKSTVKEGGLCKKKSLPRSCSYWVVVNNKSVAIWSRRVVAEDSYFWSYSWTAVSYWKEVTRKAIVISMRTAEVVNAARPTDTVVLDQIIADQASFPIIGCDALIELPFWPQWTADHQSVWKPC